MSATFPQHHEREETRSLAGLFVELWRETSTLFRQEAELAKAELSEKVSQVESGFAALAAGGAILFAGLLVLLAAAVAGVARVLPPEHASWLSPLMVGLVVALIGGVLLAKARKDLRRTNLRPTRTMASVRADGRMVKEHIK